MFSKLPIDYSRLSRELFKATRGSRSQNWVNRKLGVTYNICYRFESGNKKIHWNDFLTVCSFAKLDLSSIFLKTMEINCDLGSAHVVLAALKGNLKIGEFAVLLGESRTKVSRWLSGDTQVPFDIILKAIELGRQCLINFATEISSLDQLPSIHNYWKMHHAEKDLISSHPIAAALIESLVLQEYLDAKNPSAKTLADLLDIEEELVATLLAQMCSLGIVEKVGNHYGRRAKHLDTRGLSFEKDTNIRKYWIQFSLDQMSKLQSKSKKETSGYLVYSSNETLDELILQRYLDFYHDVIALIGGSKTGVTPQSVRLLNVNMVSISKLMKSKESGDTHG